MTVQEFRNAIEGLNPSEDLKLTSVVSDRVLLLAMLKRNAIGFSEEAVEVVVEAGYAGFYTSFKFDDAGNLKAVEAYE